MSSTTGQLFRVTTYGESHGKGIGCIIDGCPPNVTIDLKEIQYELRRRRPGQSNLTTPRKERDEVNILSGLFEGRTLGSPIALSIANKDADSKPYAAFSESYRPSHADFTTEEKYGIRDWRGGGRASARETAARVAAGAIAKQILKQICDIEILAWVNQVANIRATVDSQSVHSQSIENNILRCPDAEAADRMEALIREARRDKDSVGGVISCICRNVPSGLGEPVFDKLEAELAKAMLSIPACKGFEIGSGFAGTVMRGSEHNDPFVIQDGKVQTSSNNSGGIQGGISNGMPILFSVAFKPVATIFKPQVTVNSKKETVTLSPKGRHDPCVLPRAVPIVEAMAALTLMDHFLRQEARRSWVE